MEEDRAGVERRLRRLANRLCGVGLHARYREVRVVLPALALQRSLRWARVAPSVCGHIINVRGVSSLVGVRLPLWFALLVRAAGPFQLRLASRATRSNTPCGGMALLPILIGVTVGSCKYIMYVDQRWSLMGLVHGAFLFCEGGAAGALMVLLASSTDRKSPK
jgi:hypothetical protein